MSANSDSPLEWAKPVPKKPLTPYRVTMDDVARVAGVSRATVSRVMTGNSSVSAETIEVVNRAIEELGYVPNPAARSLAGRRNESPTVGLLLRDPMNSVYGYLFVEMQRQADEHGFSIVASAPTVRGSNVDEMAALNRLVQLGVDGVFLATGSIKPSDVETLLDKVPMISVGRPELHDEITAVGYDEDKNGELIAAKILEHGHTRVGIELVSEHISVPENRRGQAILRSLRAAGVSVELVRVNPHDAHMANTNQMLRLVRERSISCVAFPTDRRAVRFMQAAQIAGVSVPQDVSVTGLDGISTDASSVSLATIRIPLEVVASRAARIMGSRIENPRQPVTHEVFAGTFVRGDSLAGPTL
ncbi:LacI family transcriptional regulator [Corynebacterium sanguinis]|uniref:LacI family transcriptional regulator n=2 Tax=Corynebacterium sanguinis TaxID=2594913 RepID=A0A6C1TUM6_9CORY|nr:LacI family transcriptional regulator [Corynebacterium sanguinis]